MYNFAILEPKWSAMNLIVKRIGPPKAASLFEHSHCSVPESGVMSERANASNQVEIHFGLKALR